MTTNHVDLLNRVVRLAHEGPTGKTYLLRAINFDGDKGSTAWLEECNKFGGAQGGKLRCAFLGDLCFE